MEDVELNDIEIRPTRTLSQLSTGPTRTWKGLPIEGRQELSTWQQIVRLAVSSVLPSGKYQRHVVDVDQVDSAPFSVVSAGQKTMVDGTVKYDMDNYIEAYNCKPPTLFIPIITLIEVGVFIGYAVADGGVTATQGGVPHDSPLLFNPARRYEAWRFITYMLLHQGYLHLIFNLFVQLLLGIPLEMVHKWHRVGTVYLLGVIAGSCAHAVFDRWTLLAGASGGVYALIGAHLAIIVMNWKEMNYDWMGSVGKFISSAPVRLSIWLILVGADTGVALYQRYGTDEESRVGYAAHFGGALAGFLVGIPVMINLERNCWEDVLWYLALTIYLALMIFVVLWNCFYPDYPTTDWRKCCPDAIITHHRIQDD